MDRCQIDKCKLKIEEINWASQWTDSLGFENWWQLCHDPWEEFQTSSRQSSLFLFLFVSYAYVF